MDATALEARGEQAAAAREALTPRASRRRGPPTDRRTPTVGRAPTFVDLERFPDLAPPAANWHVIRDETLFADPEPDAGRPAFRRLHMPGGSFEGLLDVLDELVGRFNPHRHTHQAIANPQLHTIFARQSRMRSRGGSRQ